MILPPSGLKAGFSVASVSTVVPGRMPSSDSRISPVSWPSASLIGMPDELAVEARLGGRRGRPLLAPGGEGVEVLA